jgi:hypothetical protein
MSFILQHYWPFYDASPDDVVGTGITVTPENGVTYTAGKTTDEARFAHTSGFSTGPRLDLASSVVYDGDWTITFWIRKNNFDAFHSTLVLGDPSLFSRLAVAPGLGLGDSAQHWYIGVTTYDEESEIVQEAEFKTPVMVPNQDHFLVIEYKAGVARVFFDNDEVAGTDTTIADAELHVTGVVGFEWFSGSGSVETVMAVGELAILEGTLTESERNELWSNGDGRTYNWLLGFEVEITEALRSLENVNAHYVEYADDALSGADELVFLHAVLPKDVLQVTDPVQTMQRLAVSATDVCRAILSVRPQYVLSLLEQAQAADTIDFVQALHLMERARATDTYATLRAASLILGLTARDMLGQVYSESIYEALEADVEMQEHLRRVAEALDQVQAALASEGTFVLAINETLSASAQDSIATLGHYLSNITEQTGSWVGFKLGDEQYTGVVMNTEGEMPISTYEGYGFNSFAEIGGRYYGASDEGVFLLEGATDDGEPIPASLSTMMLDFGSARQKRITSAYLGYTSSGKLLLKVRSVDEGVLKEQWYEARKASASVPQEDMIRLGRGMRSRYWQFELVNVDGADFEIDALELHPVYLNRRV